MWILKKTSCANYAITAIAACVLASGCGPSDAAKDEKEKYRKEIAAREQAFYRQGPVVISELKTADGVLQNIEIPIKDSMPMVKRCVLFVSESGGQAVTCEEPAYKDFD